MSPGKRTRPVRRAASKASARQKAKATVRRTSTKSAAKAASKSVARSAAAAPPKPEVPATPPLSKTNVRIERTPGAGGQPGTVTLRLSRVFKAPPERIWHCFTDPDAYAKWIPPHGFVGHVHHMEPKVGGSYRMSFATINRSWTESFGGRYLEVKPYEKIVHTDKFETTDPAMQGEMRVTILLKPVAAGTELTVVQEHIPDGPAAAGAPIGWGQSLDNLQRLVEQELPF